MSRTRQRRRSLHWTPDPRPGCVRSLSYDYASGHRVPPHVHDWHQLVHAVRGVMTLTTDGGSWIVPANRAVWVPALVEHAIRMSGPVSMRTLYLDPRVARELPRACRVVDVAPLLRELIVEVVARGGLDRRVARERHLACVLLDQIRAAPAIGVHLPEPTDPRARRIADRLADDPADPRALAALARGSGASPRTLQRLFRAETGMTFDAWRRQLRLAHALTRLAGGGSVTEVALDAGYASVSAFVSIFRRTFGETPGRVRPRVITPSPPGGHAHGSDRERRGRATRTRLAT
jgi:AraC-like DNA-binding protein